MARTAVVIVLDVPRRIARGPHVNSRLGQRCFTIDVPKESREFLLKAGTSAQYGARELNRTVHRQLTQPLATMVATGQIPAGGKIRVDLLADQSGLVIHTEPSDPESTPHPTVSSSSARIEKWVVRNLRSTSVLYAIPAGRLNSSR